MRNLKRALSLTLASVMLLGMMVVGANAASYPDVSEEDNIEAIEVLQAVKVMVGDDNGNFGPEQPVNRSQMAVVMALLLNLDYDYYEGTNPFWDVPSWAEPYVAACYANGIVSGYNAYEYGAGDPVTAVQAASMMMRALGYFQYASDYKDGFELSTVKQASQIALFKDINANATDALTRNQVAQLALNTLKADMVDAQDNTFNITSSTGDATISATGGQITYVVRTSASDFARAIDSTTFEGGSIDGRQGSIIQLGEQLYQGELKLIDARYHVDDFGRPARTWEYKGQEIGTYAKKEQLKTQYTEKVTGKMLYDLLGSNTINTYGVSVTIDGEDDAANNPAVFGRTAMNRTNDKKVGETGNGVLTQVYVDTENKDIYIAIVNTYLAIASDDYNEKKDTANLDVYKLSNPSNGLYLKDTSSNPPYDVNDLDVTGDDFNIENVQEGDMFLVTVANGVIKSMVEPEVLTNEVITTYSRNSYVTVDGNRHDYATTAAYDEDVMDNYNDGDMKNVTYNIILDQYGYLIGVEEYNAVDNYVFMTGIEDDFSKLSKKNVEANVIFLDGSMETITVDKAESTLEDANFTISEAAQVNRWYTYGVDNNGIYTLELVDTTGASGKKVSQSLVDLDGYIPETTPGSSGDDTPAEIRNINTKNISLPGTGILNNVYGNDETVYINTVTAGIPSDASTNSLIIDDVDSVTVGIGNVDLKVIGLGEGDAHVPTKYTKTIKGTAYNCPDGEIYALYHNEGKEAGYIIGVVTLDAEDSNTSTIYAFMNTNKIDRRSYDDSTGKWTWYREAVIDGEISELAYTNTTQSSLGSDGNLESLTRGEWYEVKLKADGTVKSAEPITYVANSNPVNTTNIGTHDITQIGASADAVNKDFIFQGVYAQGGEANLTYKSNTLYTDTAQTEGIYVDKNAKIVVFVDTFDDKDTFTDMTKALKFLNDAENFEGRLNAVVDKNGRAQVVILDERSTAPTEPMTITINLVGDDKADLGTVTVEWDGQNPITSATLTTDDVRVDDGLAALGYTEPGTPNSYNGTFVEGGSDTTTFEYEAGEPETLEYTSVLPDEDWDDDDIDTDMFEFDNTTYFDISGLEIKKFNAVYPKSTLKTQLTEYLESQGYKDVKNIAYSGNADGSSNAGYTFDATGEDDISRPMFVKETSITWYARITLDDVTAYVDDSDLSMSAVVTATNVTPDGMYAKDKDASDYFLLTSSTVTDAKHGHEYESGYVKVVMDGTAFANHDITNVTAGNCGAKLWDVEGGKEITALYLKESDLNADGEYEVTVRLTLVADSGKTVTLTSSSGVWNVSNEGGATGFTVETLTAADESLKSGAEDINLSDDSTDPTVIDVKVKLSTTDFSAIDKDTSLKITIGDTATA